MYQTSRYKMSQFQKFLCRQSLSFMEFIMAFITTLWDFQNPNSNIWFMLLVYHVHIFTTTSYIEVLFFNKYISEYYRFYIYIINGLHIWHIQIYHMIYSSKKSVTCFEHLRLKHVRTMPWWGGYRTRKLL